ncbi:hypothetical protein [Bythopirellula polymerisocia]|uniref:Uncharacterized protein n=1 Tax=Bythopirellula polymerisocia TaxID=2528003 RepID=A0A5C6CGS4_9BACT|nr:hypothetical protein [Bythopirellula polymerisocia]TWU22764.1 hypothetical protein Pla144_42250 [Bythopirellula polymerisocia]
MPTKTSSAAKNTSNSKPAKTSSKSRATKSKAPKVAEDSADQEVTIDRRREERREDESTAPAKLERRTKVQRRRQIDPTTCERDYSDEEVSFMSALDEYKRKNGRMFPTCSEVLEVIRSLGYVKLSPAELAVVRPESEEATENTASEETEELETEEAFELETV